MNTFGVGGGAIWSYTTRNLTGFGTGALVISGSPSSPLLTATHLDISAPGGSARSVSCATNTPNVAGAAGEIDYTDGTVIIPFPGTTLGINAGAAVPKVLCTNTTWIRVQNTGSQTNRVMYSVYDLVQ